MFSASPARSYWQDANATCPVDMIPGARFDYREMKRVFVFAAMALICHSTPAASSSEQPVLLTHIKPLPKALDPNFEFRKTKLYLLTEQAPETKRRGSRDPTKVSDFTSSKSATVVQAASITFERQYRLFGAVTKLDQHQRFGNYFDFFWRAKQSADIIMRLEYRQEKLHAHVQAQEISYANIRGHHKTEFKVIGDDYFDGGRVIAWRCLMIQDGKIVAEDRSFLWE